jgi:hemerythrin
MAVGHPMIDADHRRLIELINTAELAFKGVGPQGTLADTLDGLTAYANEHFRREEDVMSLLGYDGLSQHREAHRMLRVRLREIRGDIEGKAGVASPREIDRLIELLRAWLLDHVLKDDMRLKPILK